MHPKLQIVRPAIVIIEEAAEVLEAHILTSLSSGLRHLILIGDHFQLRPSSNVHELATDYNLEISLFERMTDNNCPQVCLNVQHRMRPEISGPLMPHFYNDLQDHESVREYEDILGVKSNVCFITHNQPETATEFESTSCKNHHEATFAVALGIYFLQQGYSPSQITILSPYSDQLNAIRGQVIQRARQGGKLAAPLKDIKVTTVDNYQGEENDIVILSLVRSNMVANPRGDNSGNSSIGFCGIKNRVCVALSRARKGFFVLGNFSFFERRNSLWRGICNSLRHAHALKPQLQLECWMHGTVSEVSSARDLQISAPEGGCNVRCSTTLVCGHKCVRFCHPDNFNHHMLDCTKRCQRRCTTAAPDDTPHQCGSVCTDCWFPRDEDDEASTEFVNTCNPCEEHINRVLDGCGHLARNVVCGIGKAAVKCNYPCVASLACGHQCDKKCHSSTPTSHTQMCRERVTKLRSFCEHEIEVLCFQDPNDATCRKPCGEPCTTAPPGVAPHKCRLPCYKCEDGGCPPCTQLVNRVIQRCGHLARNVPCGITMDCQEFCQEKLACEHECAKYCHSVEVSHTEKCQVAVTGQFNPPCEHTNYVMCHKKHAPVPCSASVTKRWPQCGHCVPNVPCSTDVATTACPKCSWCTLL